MDIYYKKKYKTYKKLYYNLLGSGKDDLDLDKLLEDIAMSTVRLEYEVNKYCDSYSVYLTGNQRICKEMSNLIKKGNDILLDTNKINKTNIIRKLEGFVSIVQDLLNDNLNTENVSKTNIILLRFIKQLTMSLISKKDFDILMNTSPKIQIKKLIETLTKQRGGNLPLKGGAFILAAASAFLIKIVFPMALLMTCVGGLFSAVTGTDPRDQTFPSEWEDE